MLSTLRPSVSGVESAVVDGLRHLRILEALRKIPTVQVQIATILASAVTPTEAIEASMTQDEIERSETEAETVALAREAMYTLPRDRKELTRTLVAL